MSLLPKLQPRRRQPEIVLGTQARTLGRLPLGSVDYALPLADLNTHLYVVGRSGKGKSKFLEGFLWQLINHGQGCGLIDPHGDLANNLLKLLAFEDRGVNGAWLDNPANARRLIYCEPGRRDTFLPMNVLADNNQSPYTIATNVIEAFQRTWSESLREAPQFKNVCLHALLLLIEHGLSLAELPWLLMDAEFRERLLASSRNQEVIAFFQLRFDRWGKEQPLRVESILNKVTALTLNDSLKNMLGASENVLNARSMMDEGKILIVNLGTADHETSNLLGSLLTVGLEQAALTRVEMAEEKRRRWYCVLDEFQRFVANEGSALVLAQMLSEARKMGLFLCLAHQGWHQLGHNRLEGALDQAQIKVIFGSGTQTGRIVAEELFMLDPDKVKHEVADPEAQGRTHPYFESIMEQKELFIQAIRTQKQREVLLLPPESNEVVALRTMQVPQPEAHPQDLEEVKVKLLQGAGAQSPPHPPDGATTTGYLNPNRGNGQVPASGLVEASS